MKKLSSIIIVIAFLQVTANTMAAIHCVRSGANGNGSGTDWTNAYATLPSSLIRGDTYYIADGDYNSYTFDAPESRTNYIYIKKAIISDHGTDIGWDNSYGDGTAKFGATIKFETSYWIFDGQTGGGPDNWKSGYGFEVYYSGISSQVKIITINNGSSYIDILHVKLQHAGDIGVSRDAYPTGHDVFYCIEGGDHITLSHCALLDCGRVHLKTLNMTNFKLEYCYLYRNGWGSAQHTESIADTESDNVIIRYCIFEKCRGTGIIVTGLGGNSSQEEANWDIYGNVFYKESDWGGVTDGTIAVLHENIVTNWQIHHNTFIDLRPATDRGNTGFHFSQSNSSSRGIRIYNNIWFNCKKAIYTGDSRIEAADFNYYINTSYSSEPNIQTGTEDPFIDKENYNFRLKNATQPGIELTSPYNLDMNLRIRGSDKIWDRGAFEYDKRAPVNFRFVR